MTEDGFEDWFKKPVKIQARQRSEPFEIQTLEGLMKGNAGDYEIIGVKGEKYPCKPDVFAATYSKEQAVPKATADNLEEQLVQCLRGDRLKACHKTIDKLEHDRQAIRLQIMHFSIENSILKEELAITKDKLAAREWENQQLLKENSRGKSNEKN